MLFDRIGCYENEIAPGPFELLGRVLPRPKEIDVDLELDVPMEVITRALGDKDGQAPDQV